MPWLVILMVVMAILGIWSLTTGMLNKKVSKAIQEELKRFDSFFGEYKKRKPIDIWWDYHNKANMLGSGFRGTILFQGGVSFRFSHPESFYIAILIIRDKHLHFAPQLTKDTLWSQKRNGTKTTYT